jgi:hypothetical protein
MKNLFKATIVAFLASAMISCGGADRANFVGNWTPDLSSVDIHISDKIPGEMKDEMDIDKMKSEMKKNQKMADMVNMEFKEDGTFTVGPEGKTQDFKWDIDGDNLVISGKIPQEADGDFAGKDFSFAFEVVESSTDEFTIKLTGSSIREQAEAQFKEQYDEMMEQAGPMIGLLDLDGILADTWASLKFKKKSAEA